MVKYILKRVAILLVILWVVIILSSFPMQVMPGTPYNNPKPTDEMIALMNKQHGLDKPVWWQYLTYPRNILHGDFGTSYQSINQSVSRLVSQRLGVSIQLSARALAIGLIAGILASAASARSKNNRIDGILSIISTSGISMPSLIIGLFLLVLLSLKWSLFPLAGQGTFAQTVMPSVALTIPMFAQVARFFRGQMIETLNSDYIRLAVAKELIKYQITRKYAYRNSMIPVLTLIGPVAVNFLTGSALIEQTFSIPGIDQQFIISIPTKDYPVVTGTTIIYAMMLIVVILVTDTAASIVDLRVRLRQGKQHGREKQRI